MERFAVAIDERRKAADLLVAAERSEEPAAIAFTRSSFTAWETEMRTLRQQATALVRDVSGDATYNDVNYVFPTFILTQLPIGLIGLLMAAILLAATDSIAAELNSLSTATVIDFYRRYVTTAGVRCPLSQGLALCHRVLGSLCQPGRHLGGRSRLADRGRQPVWIVLLRLDPRRVPAGVPMAPGQRHRGVRRVDRGHGRRHLGGDDDEHLVSVAQRGCAP